MALFKRRKEQTSPGPTCLVCGKTVEHGGDTRKLVLEQTNGWVLKHQTNGELCTICWDDLLETIATKEKSA